MDTTSVKQQYKFFVVCRNCGKKFAYSDLPPEKPYYNGEVDSLFFPCDKCGGTVRSNSGKVIGGYKCPK